MADEAVELRIPPATVLPQALDRRLVRVIRLEERGARLLLCVRRVVRQRGVAAVAAGEGRGAADIRLALVRTHVVRHARLLAVRRVVRPGRLPVPRRPGVGRSGGAAGALGPPRVGVAQGHAQGRWGGRCTGSVVQRPLRAGARRPAEDGGGLGRPMESTGADR